MIIKNLMFDLAITCLESVGADLRVCPWNLNK